VRAETRSKDETRVRLDGWWKARWMNQYPEETLDARFVAWFENVWHEACVKDLRRQAHARLRSMFRVR
jgi:hypothetical protein